MLKLNSISTSLLAACLLVSLALSAQSRLGVGATLDYTNRTNLLPDFTNTSYNGLEVRSALPSVSFEYFFLKNLSVQAEGQFGISHSYVRYFAGILFKTFDHQEKYIRTNLALRYHPTPFLFVGAGPALELLTYQSQTERDSPVGFANNDFADKPLARRFAAHFQAGVFFKGFEAQLSYYVNPGYEERTEEYFYYQANITRNLLIPVLRYTVDLRPKRKRK